MTLLKQTSLSLSFKEQTDFTQEAISLSLKRTSLFLEHTAIGQAYTDFTQAKSFYSHLG